MPYIKKDLRPELDSEIKALAKKLDSMILQDGAIVKSGVLNYTITKLIKQLNFKVNYENYNAIIGCLNCIITEIERRDIAPYEDKKIIENGDVVKD